MSNINDILGSVRIKPLSGEERARVWSSVASNLATTPTETPFVFPLRSALSAAVGIAVAVLLVTANNAGPGDPLFPLDLAMESARHVIDGSSRAISARERVAEVTSFVTSTETPTDQRMAKESAPVADTASFALMAAIPAQETTTLPPELADAVAVARTNLERLLNEALTKNDTVTADEIRVALDELDTFVNTFRQ